MGVDSTTFQFALKRRYPQSEIENEVYKTNPLLAMVEKDTENIAGDAMALAVSYADTQGRSATFSKAQANKGNNAGKQFLLQTISDYALATITGKVIRQSKSNPGSFLRAAEKEMDSAINNLKRAMGIDAYRSGTGKRGARGSINGNVVTLSQIQDITNFEVGMKLVASQNDGGALRAGAAAVIDSLDRDAGTITSTTWGNITAFADADSLYVEGDAAAGGANLKLSGLLAWLPSTAPAVGGGDSFFGVDRSADPTRLAGIRMDISSIPLLEGGVKAANRLGREGGDPDYWAVGFDQMTNIIHELGAKVTYVDIVGGEGRFGFTGVRVTAGQRSLIAFADQNCPHDRSFMLQLNKWKLYSLGPAPDYLDEDGLKMLRESASDGYEVRLGYYAQLGCEAPGYNANLQMPT